MKHAPLSTLVISDFNSSLPLNSVEEETYNKSQSNLDVVKEASNTGL